MVSYVCECGSGVLVSCKSGVRSRAVCVRVIFCHCHHTALLVDEEPVSAMVDTVSLLRGDHERCTGTDYGSPESCCKSCTRSRAMQMTKKSDPVCVNTRYHGPH